MTMKNLNFYIIIFMSLLCFSCFSDEEIKNDLKENNLKGKVKSMEEAVYDVVEKDGGIEKSSLNWKHLVIYNKDGNKIMKKTYKLDGSLEDVYKFIYDEKGRLLEEVGGDVAGKYLTKMIYEYDNKGGMIEDNLWAPKYSHPIITRTHKYDEKGRLIESIDWWSYRKSKVMWKYVYEYNDNGKVSIEKLYKDDRGRIKEWVNTSYEYNENGDKIREVIKSARFDPSIYTFKYKYDEKGNWIRRIQTDQGEPYQIMERTIEYYD
jgi:hypothetical protein